MPLRLLFITCSIGLVTAWAQMPQITIASATSKQVRLTWTATPGASSYSVFRVPTVVASSGIPGSALNISLPSFSQAIATVNGLSFTDALPDPNATYTYCVLPGFGTCNNVIVDPPPFGFNTVPSTSDNCESAGIMERMELDGNGDPAMAYVVIDPNGDGDESDDTIYFVSWNRARYAWNPPVVVAVPEYLDEVSEGPTMPLSLARDAATGMWCVLYNNQAFPDGNGTIALATSTDGGITWKSQSISGSPFSGYLYPPSLALWNGSFYALFLTDNTFFGPNLDPFSQGDGFVYVTGKVTDPPANWTSQVVPFPGD